MDPALIDIDSLVLDAAHYPRPAVDSSVVTDYAAAIKAGDHFPPIIVCRKTRIVADGWHRVGGHERLGIKKIRVEWRDFTNADALFEFAAASCARNGLRLGPYERDNLIAKAKNRGFSDRRIAKMLGLDTDRLSTLIAERTASYEGALVAIKKPLREGGLAGGELTEAHMEANRHAGGMRGAYYVQQTTRLLRSGLLRVEDERVREAVEELYSAIAEALFAHVLGGVGDGDDGPHAPTRRSGP